MPATTICSVGLVSQINEGTVRNILIAEGTPAAWQAERAHSGIPSNFSLFAATVRLHCPDIRCTPLNIADGEALPLGTALADFDGVPLTGEDRCGGPVEDAFTGSTITTRILPTIDPQHVIG
jgi:hypothetical protein